MIGKRLSLCLISLLSLGLLAPAFAAGGGGSSGPYLALDPPFVVNVQEGNRMRFMQVKAQVLVDDSGLRRIIEHNMPAVRDAFILLLADQDAATVRSPEGRERLRQQALQAVEAVLGEFTNKTGIEGIYFTDFVIQ